MRSEFINNGQAELDSSVFGVQSLPNSTIVEYEAEDARTYYRTMEVMATLANTAH